MNEVERRKLKFDSLHEAWCGDEPFRHAQQQRIAPRDERDAEAMVILDELRASGDPDQFRQSIQGWAQKPGYDSFKGLGAMYLHQLVNYTDDPAASSSLLIECLAKPTSVDDAAAKIRRCAAHVDHVKRGGQPAPRRTPFVLSLFWSMADREQWPCLWSSADAVLTELGWLTPPGDLDLWYVSYRDIVMTSGYSPFEVEAMLYWVHETHPFTGLDPALIDRCRENVELANARINGEYPTTEAADRAERNTRAMLGELKLVGSQLEERVGAALGRPVAARVPGLKYDPHVFRADAFVAWQIGKNSEDPSLWLWATDQGLAIGLQPGWREQGWTDRVRKELAGGLPAGVEFVRLLNQIGGRLQPTGSTDPGGMFLVGRFYPGTDRLGDVTFADEIEAVAAAVQPVLDRVTQLHGGTTSDSLADFVARFVAERPYPTAKDATNIADRELLLAPLSRDDAEPPDQFDLDNFRQIINTVRYGHPGQQAMLNATLRDAGPDELSALAQAIDYLLWEETDTVETRINRVLDKDDLGVRGLAGSVVMKLLALAHPDRFLAVYPLRGNNGKREFMKLLGLPALEKNLSRGERHVISNDRLRAALEPHFPGDPWAQSQFLYWLRDERSKPEPEPGPAPTPDLTALNDELLFEAGFLDEVMTLLEDKGQVIFYGPPGTGKTYVAKKLAEALTADPSRRAIVQFHPSTSYEDFFEGYRPRASIDGAMTYELVPGPLARMAALAAQSPSVTHVMVVDEINRANLPKVFGELLFLLEYRSESIQVLYRPDEPFRLPKNLYVIGTMNTADRSIALVDAALRRRFHFVPFFPEQEHMQGVLRRWLQENDGDVRIAALVEQVNQELVLDVGEHLQIGPSYFMRKEITEAELRRIWKYSIEPFVEEQLFGQTEEIKRYRWTEVRQRYWGTLTAAPDDPIVTDESA